MEPERRPATVAECEGEKPLFQKEHLVFEFLTQNEIYAAGFSLNEDCGKKARRQSLCLRGERGVGLNHSFFMNDQGQYRLGLRVSVRKVDNDGRVQEIWVSRQGNAHASSEGVIHWIDVIAFWFLLFCSSP
jgi:hypothetical protein